MRYDKYADDIRQIDLSQNILLKRGSDIIADAIIYHGDCYYAPVEAEDQGIDKRWMPMERYDLILEWRPVNIAAVLREAI